MLKPFFIVGSPRSGTTLLERLLNRHSKLFIPPETEFFHQLKLFEADFTSENNISNRSEILGAVDLSSIA